MQKYTVSNIYDGHDAFDVDADSLAHARSLALAELGWGVEEPDEGEERAVIAKTKGT